MATADEMERAAKRDAPNPRDPWPEVGKIAKTIGDRNVKFNETVTPSTDFRDGKALELAELDYRDTTRELSKAAKRMEEVQNQRAEAMAEPGYFLGDGSAAEVPYRDFLSEQAALDSYWRDLGKAPSSADEAQYWNKIVAAAAEQGVKVDPADAKNLTDWRLVNFASDRMVKLLVADPVKNALAVENIAESLSKVSPEMASMGFMLANTKFEELAKDPNLAQKGVGFLVEILGGILEPFIAANEFAQQNYRASAYNAREIERDGGNQFRQLYGSIAGALGYNRGMVEKGDYDETYLETIPTAVDSQGKRLFTDIEIEIAMLLHMGSTKDPEFNPNFAVEEFLLNKQGEDYAEGYRAFGNIISNTGPRADAMATLMRQIDSAHDGNTGLIGASTVSSGVNYNPISESSAPVVYDPQRGEGTYQFTSNFVGFATSVIIDPTIVGFAAYRGIQATRYALSQVAPQASMNAVGAEKLLASGGGFLGLNNKTHRFFKTLSGDLNEYEILGARVQRNNAGKFAGNEAEEVARLKGVVDENNAYVKNATASAKIDGRVDPIEKTVQAAFDEDLLAYQRAVKAEKKARKRGVPVTEEEQAQRVAQDQTAYDALRQRISRRYNQIPDDLITDILATAPRVNKNGVIVPRVAADGTINEGRITAESIAEFANNKNNDYVFEIANIERVALAKGQLASDLPRIVADLLDQKRIESFDQALNRGVKKTKRAEMTPQMTSGTVVRSRISNWIASNVMSDRASAKILQEYVDTTSAKTISKSFSDNAVQIGQESKNVASGGLTPSFTEGSGIAGAERVAGIGDSLGRMGSSISRLSMVDLSTGDAAEEVNKYARQFLPKGLAATAANAFREGDVGSRRILMSGIVRAAAQSRGLVIPKGAIDAWQHRSAAAMNVTGTRKGESYGAAFKPSEMPTVRLANQQDQLWREDEIRRLQTLADEGADQAENVNRLDFGAEKIGPADQAILSSHPNMTFYKDGGKGGVGKDSGVVGPVKTTFLKDFMGNPTDRDKVEFFKKELAEGRGFNESIIVLYNPAEGKFFVGEGNHRLQAAFEMGEEFVPVRVNRSYFRDDASVSSDRSTGNVDVSSSPWKDGAGENYWPTDLHPSYLFGDNAPKPLSQSKVPDNSPPKILTLTDSEDSILSGDFTQGMTAWRNQVLDDEDLYSSFKISEIGTGSELKFFKPDAKSYKPEQWIDEIIDETGIPPRAPWNVGAFLNKSQQNRFVHKGTISRDALQEIEEYLGVEKFLQWMRYGETDDIIEDLPSLQGVPGRKRDYKGEIPGWDGVPDEWLFGADWNSKWIPVPWAQGGVSGRGLAYNKTEQAIFLRKKNDDELDIRFDEEFARGELDEQLDDWMISRRDQGDPRFQPEPARVPVVNPLFREPVIRDIVDGDEIISLSADEKNIQSALHMYQTRTHMRVPNLSDFEDMRKNQGAFGRGMYAAHKVSEEYTNFWSIFTLFGWRFSIRNAVEEVGMWFGTAGSVVDLAKGRAASTNRRRVDREMYVMEPTFASSDDAIPKVVYKAEQGLIGRTVESIRVKAQEASGNTNRTAAAWQREWSEAQGLPGYLMRYFVIPAMGPRTKNLEAIKKAQIKSKFSDPKTNDEFVIANKDRNDLIAEGIVGSRVGRVGLLNESDAQIIKLAGENSHFVHLLDDINQSGTYINSARNPAGLASGRQQLDANEELPPGVLPGRIDQEAAQAALNKAIDDANISGMTIQRISGTSMKDVNSKKMVDEWHHILRATLQGGDELTSTIAVQGIADISRGLTTSARVKADLADVIRNDPDGKYQEMFSRLTNDESITQFASDYFDDILNMFQTQEGGISTRLLDMFTDTNGVYQGWAKQVDSTLVNKLDLDLGVSVDMTDRVTAQMLRGIPINERPTIMSIDRNGEQYIPYANTLPAIISMKYSDRLYRWMGRQNARLSREPIFWANVLGMWSMSTVRRTNLSKRIAEAKGQVWDELDDAAKLRAEDMANQLVSKDVFDRAYSVTMSFMDNPSNRSNLAWKARNVSRYYRASEDFYRRMGRVAVSNPEAYAKFAIGYSLLDDTGLVYTDDNGDKYFQYPMNQVVQDTMNWFLMKSSGLSDMETGSGFNIGGKILGSTPSLDPMNMIPPLTSGTGSLVGAAAFRLPFLKELAGARALVMGQFNQPSGDLTEDIMAALMPAGLTRMWGLIDTDARESNSAGSTMDAIAMMSGEGLFDLITLSDGSTIDKDYATEEEILNSKEMRVANLVATGLELSKLVFAYGGPSFPMINADNVSQWARMNGYDNMTDGWYDFQDDVAFDPEYLDMVEEFTQDKIYDPWGQAAQKWYLMRAGEELDYDNEFGWVGSFVPYTVSGSESTGSSVLKQASFRATEEGYKFLTNSETGYASYPDEFKAASLFLAPREGAFDWAAHLYAKNLLSLRVPKATNELAVEIVRSESIAEKRRAALSYAQKLDALDKNAPAYEQQVSWLNKQKAAEWAEKGYSGATDNVYAFQDMEINRDDANESYIAVKKMLAWKKDNEGLDVFPAGSTEALMEEAITIWDESLMELKVYAGSNYDRARKDIKAERTAKLDALQLGNAQVKHFRDSTMWG